MIKGDNISINRKRENLIILFFLLFSFCLLLTVGTDGWYRTESVRGDSAWFMMGGKAWMSGLVPYVDFSDSKGPLLWLIYGLGYLISPFDFHGVFWFEVLFYWLNFWLLFKTAKIFLRDDARSIVASVAMSFLYFYPGVHQEIRVEDFCHVFHTGMFYVLVKTLYLHDLKIKYFISAGCILAAVLLIKYSYFITLCIPVAVLFLFVIVSPDYRGQTLRFLIYLIIGFLVVTLPFAVYLICVGAFLPFIKEYFMSTGITIMNVWEEYEHNPDSLRGRWPFYIWKYYRGIHYFSEFMRFILLGFLLTLYLCRRSGWMMVALALWYVFSVLLFSIVDGTRYFITDCIMAFGGIIFVIKWMPRFNLPFSFVLSGVILALLVTAVTHYIYSELHYPQRDNKVLAVYYKISDIINEAERNTGRRPTIVFYKDWDRGEHVKARALPGVKYWAIQAGMTEEMYREQEEDIFNKRPDFVIVNKSERKALQRIRENNYIEMLEYYPYPNFTDGIGTCILFENGDLIKK